SPSQAFDGVLPTTNANKWWTGTNTTPSTASPCWVQNQFAAGATWIVTQYKITAADTQSRDPKNWTLQGSNNGTTWTVLDTQTGRTFPARYATNTYSIVNTTAYAYYRLSTTA